MKKPNLAQLLMLAIVFLTACKNDPPDFSNTTANTNPGGTTTTADYYFKGTLNGQAVNWPASPDGSPGYVTGSGSATTLALGVVKGGIEALISKTTGLQPQLGIEFETFQVSLTQDVAAYLKTFISTGTWPFRTDDSPGVANVKDLVIFYTDSNGKDYYSVGAQAGSATVVSVTPIAATAGHNESLKIKLTFSCVLYPGPGDKTGNPIPLTNAEATVLLEENVN